MITKKGMFIKMKTIKQGIVFSNDIQNILKGYNTINYSYNKNGIITPPTTFIENLRQDFTNTVNQIFNGNTTIITEEEMKQSIEGSIKDVKARFPHHLTR